MNIHSRYTRGRAQALKRYLYWSLSFQEYADLWGLPCYYCNTPLAGEGVGLDRLDNNMGYEVLNVVPCCPACNLIKNWLLTPDEMLAVVHLLIKMRGGEIHWDTHTRRRY